MNKKILEMISLCVAICLMLSGCVYTLKYRRLPAYLDQGNETTSQTDSSSEIVDSSEIADSSDSSSSSNESSDVSHNSSEPGKNEGSSTPSVPSVPSVPDADNPIGYNVMRSPFNTDKTTYASWIMFWNASSESWHNPYDSSGARILVDGKWVSIDWDSPTQLRMHLTNMKKAGIELILCDITNGFHSYILDRTDRVQELCAELGLKMAVCAGNTDNAGFEERAKITWERFAGDQAKYKDTYFKKDGKPVFVDYTWRTQFDEVSQMKTPYLSKFTQVWASGEDPDINKWGWQVTTTIGTVPSDDTMFVTSSLKWSIDEWAWTKSLAFLDYNFLMAAKSQPEILIVGSYDDLYERNSWMPVDTTNASRSYQMIDIYGNVSINAYYNRVQQWLKTGPKTVSGGILKDGAYKLKNANSGLILGTNNLQFSNELILSQVEPSGNLNDYVWLYHLGNNEYRVVRLSSGRSLSVSGYDKSEDGYIMQELDNNLLVQRWKITKVGNNYKIMNMYTEKYLDVENSDRAVDAFLVQKSSSQSLSQQWKFEPVAVIG